MTADEVPAGVVLPSGLGEAALHDAVAGGVHDEPSETVAPSDEPVLRT